MKLRWLGVCLATAFALTAQTSKAQVRGLPEEAAERAAADTQLQTNINNEAAARAGMDATLLMSIQKETDDRKAADQALRDSLNETNLVGDYAFTGTTVCLSSSRGFNAFQSPLVTFGTATFININTQTISGVRDFDGKGSGTVVARVQSVGVPTIVLGVTGTGGSGGATVSRLTGKFTYVVTDGMLIIKDDPGIAVIAQGGVAPNSPPGAPVSFVDWQIVTEVVNDTPDDKTQTFVGPISKDGRTIAITQQKQQMEMMLQYPPSAIVGVDAPFSSTPRFCNRERTLYKLKDG